MIRTRHDSPTPHRPVVPSEAPRVEGSASPGREMPVRRSGSVPGDSVDHASIAKARAASVTSSLPPEVRAAKAAVLAIAAESTEATDVKAVRAKLEPHIRVLGAYFAANRPANELEVTRGTWKSLFYDSRDLDRGPLALDKKNIYQVVEDGYYWNISDSKVRVFGADLGTVQGFLKGAYTIKDPATAANRGQEKLNVIDLEFQETRLRFGALPRDVNLRELAAKVNDREIFTLPSPGPRGIRGNLWNIYVDQDLRISGGENANKPGELQLYVLKRATTPER